MVKAKLKTQKTDDRVDKFLSGIKEQRKRKDCETICRMMHTVTGEEPKLWGTTIVGFGDVALKYDSGRELDWFRMGFSPRAANITLYGLRIREAEGLLKNLGKFKTGKGCLYINNLEDVNTDVLKKLMKHSCGE